jgi:hypothetical protein
MGKVQKRNHSSSGDKPYSRNASAKEAASKAVNKVFKMNTDLGQHILKNPGVAQAIVDKAGLKQSDVLLLSPSTCHAYTNTHRSSSKSAPELVISPSKSSSARAKSTP